MSTFFDIGGSQYIATDAIAARIASIKSFASDTPVLLPRKPVAVLKAPDGLQIDAKWVEETVNDLSDRDDVFNEDWASCILVCGTQSPHELALSQDANSLLNDWNTTTFACKTSAEIASGPYLFDGSSLLRVWKLYADPLDAFMYGVTQDINSTRFRKLDSTFIPVPSRLYYGAPSASLPLSGKRIAVKDIFDMAGVTTSASSKAYESFNGVIESTAESLQKLVDLGAVVVGKTKTAQFASGEGPMDWVDFSCPFNPRGDGYLNPSGSSTGSAAAVAGYGWLDSAIGSDTLGSILSPAANQGIYGIRPSHGLISSEGVVGVSSMLDTPGPFSRSIEGLHELGKAWYGAVWKQTTSEFPTQVLYATEFFEEFGTQRRDIMDHFVLDLENATGIKRVDFDLAATWDAQVDVKYERPVQKFLENTLAHIQLYDAYKSRIGFLQAFEARHGHQPYANPMVRFKWNLGRELTETDYENACEQMNVFRDFLEQHVFTEGTVLVLPAGKPTLNTRDDYGEGTFEQRGRSMQGFGFRRDMFSYLGGLPMLVLPIGQVKSTSTVTGEEMYEPVSVSLVGAHGTDGLLMELAKMIISCSGRMSSVNTGRTAFDV